MTKRLTKGLVVREGESHSPVDWLRLGSGLGRGLGFGVREWCNSCCWSELQMVQLPC